MMNYKKTPLLFRDIVVDSNTLLEWYVRVTSKGMKENPHMMQDRKHLDVVYLMHDPGTTIYKIGISSEPKTRLHNLINGSGRSKLYILGQVIMVRGMESAKWCEQLLHIFFEDKVIVGEWFNLRKRDIVQLIKLRDSIELRVKKLIRTETRQIYLKKKAKRRLKPVKEPQVKEPQDQKTSSIIKTWNHKSLEEKRIAIEQIASQLRDYKP